MGCYPLHATAQGKVGPGGVNLINENGAEERRRTSLRRFKTTVQVV